MSRHDFHPSMLLVPLLVILVVFGFVMTFKWKSECDAQGGEYVRGFNGMWKCVQVVQPAEGK